MRKFLFLALTLMLLLVTGCGSSDEKQIGVIRHLNITEEALNNFYEQNGEINPDKKQQAKFVFFNNMTTMSAALKSKQIDELTTYESVANYLVDNDTSLEWETSLPQLSDNFCCAMLEDNAALRDEFNAALQKISADGTLAQLVKTYIVEANYVVPPRVVEMPTFYSAPTIKVAVTGDLPPLDYILADGRPAGFNTAVLAEISKQLKKNFVLVPIEAGSRALALMSGKVDVIFWVVVPAYNETIPSNFDVPDGVILTAPYFTDEIVHVRNRD